MKVRYAVALSDLDIAWNTAAGSALLESALDAEGDPETATAEPGVPASVLAGSKDIVESLAQGLLDLALPTNPPRSARVYAQVRGEKAWTRLARADQVPYAPRPKADRASPRVDPEIAELSAPMDEATEAALRESLRAEGCREALVVWEEKDVLLDGHHRLEICRELGITFRVEKRSFPDRAAALGWFLTAQRARRSLTPHWALYYLGRQYNAAKRGNGQHGELGQSDPARTSQRVAEAAGLAEKTVRRAAAFAEALDALDRAVPHSRRAVLNREIRLSRNQVDLALDRGIRTLDDLRDLAEPEKRDALADVIRAGRSLFGALEAYRLAGPQSGDRGRMAAVNAQVRQILAEVPSMMAGLLRDLGLPDAVVPSPAEARP